MKTRRYPVAFAIFLQWIAINVIGGTAGLVVASQCQAAEILIVGGLIGLAQWLFLRRLLDRAQGWSPATLLGVLVGMLVDRAAQGLKEWVTVGAFKPNAWVWLFGVGAVMGAAVGTLQWLVLRRRSPRAAWWIPVSILSWTAMYFAVVSLPQLVFHDTTSPIAVGTVVVALLGQSVIAGIALLGLRLPLKCENGPAVDNGSWRRLALDTAIALAALVLSVGLFYAEENWRGERALDKFKREMAAKGEYLDWESFIPPPVPDEENFFKAPLMAEWFQKPLAPPRNVKLPIEWPGKWEAVPETEPIVHVSAGKDYPASVLIRWFERYDAEFKLLATACRRPKARLDSDYKYPWSGAGPNIMNFRKIAQILAARSEAYLCKGQPGLALQDLAMLERLMEYSNDRTMIVPAMVRIAFGDLYLSVVQDGIARHSWEEPQLRVISQQLSEMKFIEDYAQAMRCERAGLFFFEKLSKSPRLRREMFSSPQNALNTFELCLRFAPHGWVCQNLCRGGQLYEFAMDGMRGDANRVFPSRLAQGIEQGEREFRGITPYNWLAAFAIPDFFRSAETAAAAQTLAHQALIACALERHRQALGHYPATLDELVPRFIERLPHDVITGAPLIYRCLDDGKFLLYSVGWNEKDDGGKDSAPSRFRGADYSDWAWVSDRLDWVWAGSAAKN